MDSNHNVLFIPKEADGMYKVGDIYKLSEQAKKNCNWRILKFDGLLIKHIDYYWWTIRLHFDWCEWEQNEGAKRPKVTIPVTFKNI